MMRACLTFLLAASLLASCGSDMQPPPAAIPISAGFDSSLTQFRTTAGLQPLKRNLVLDRAAEAHAADMVARGYFAHRSPGGANGDTFADRARAAGCDLSAGAENIAAGQRSEAEVFRAWESSQGHRDNMLGAAYRAYGLGRAGDTWVMVLADRC